MSRGYLAVLAAAAALILVVGILIRPTDPEVVVQTTDESPLRQLSKDAALRNQAELVSDRVDAVADQLVLSSDGRTAVRWRRGLAVTADSHSIVDPFAVNDTLEPADTITSPRRVRWLVIAARNARDSIISVAGMSGGTTTTRCNGEPHREIVMNIAIPPAFAGAGAFTMSGERAGLVASCDGRLVIFAAHDVDATIARVTSSSYRVLQATGLDLIPATGAWSRIAGVPGLVVRRVRSGNRDFVAGDLITSVDSVSVSDTDAVLAVLRGAGSHSAVRVRNGRAARVALPTSDPTRRSIATGSYATSLQANARGVVITSMADTTTAYRAGLRTGDVIVRIGSATTLPTAETVARAFAQSATDTILVIAQRGDISSAHLLQPQEVSQ